MDQVTSFIIRAYGSTCQLSKREQVASIIGHGLKKNAITNIGKRVELILLHVRCRSQYMGGVRVAPVLNGSFRRAGMRGSYNRNEYGELTMTNLLCDSIAPWVDIYQNFIDVIWTFAGVFGGTKPVASQLLGSVFGCTF